QPPPFKSFLDRRNNPALPSINLASTKGPPDPNEVAPTRSINGQVNLQEIAARATGLVYDPDILCDRWGAEDCEESQALRELRYCSHRTPGGNCGEDARGCDENQSDA
ncbi:MAG: hypothetical protein ACI87A_003784, partial [Planctomycetota bacterium]